VRFLVQISFNLLLFGSRPWCAVPGSAALYLKTSMKHPLIFLVLFIVAIVGCDSKRTIGITPEQAVYESLFLGIAGDAHSQHYVAEATENAWFKDNPFKDEIWKKELEGLGNISIELVKELYKVNHKSMPINWKPLITNTQLLRFKNSDDQKSNSQNEECYSSINESNSENSAESRRIRPYYSVSRVAFTPDGKNALLKVSFNCALLGGGGEYFAAFGFKDNQWEVIGLWRLSIS